MKQVKQTRRVKAAKGGPPPLSSYARKQRGIDAASEKGGADHGNQE